ncbi:MAG: DUF359 domain-containing protein [Candidatus Bathyarchaeia archaeon]|nr:DUF359 domain-containing protein [Candidatus Bathyarchaeota archaeon]
MYILTPELRDELKAPLGHLIRGSLDDVIRELKELMESVRPVKIISVGDVISRSMLERGLPLNVFIVDNKSMRRPTEPIKFRADRIMELTNPAGTIMDDAWRVIGEATKLDGLVEVLVDGEEDLLTIVAVLVAPEKSMVVYGQPNEGVVVINVDEETKARMRRILERMEHKPES